MNFSFHFCCSSSVAQNKKLSNTIQQFSLCVTFVATKIFDNGQTFIVTIVAEMFVEHGYLVENICNLICCIPKFPSLILSVVFIKSFDFASKTIILKSSSFSSLNYRKKIQIFVTVPFTTKRKQKHIKEVKFVCAV